MAALLGSKRYRSSLRFVVFDVPILIGADLRDLPLAGSPGTPRAARGRTRYPLGALAARREPSTSLVAELTEGRLEGIVLKDRNSTYRDGSSVEWSKVKNQSWYEHEAWRFDRRRG
jgi:ATP-dependent DNA ligase